MKLSLTFATLALLAGPVLAEPTVVYIESDGSRIHELKAGEITGGDDEVLWQLSDTPDGQNRVRRMASLHYSFIDRKVAVFAMKALNAEVLPVVEQFTLPLSTLPGQPSKSISVSREGSAQDPAFTQPISLSVEIFDPEAETQTTLFTRELPALDDYDADEPQTGAALTLQAHNWQPLRRFEGMAWDARTQTALLPWHEDVHAIDAAGIRNIAPSLADKIVSSRFSNADVREVLVDEVDHRFYGIGTHLLGEARVRQAAVIFTNESVASLLEPGEELVTSPYEARSAIYDVARGGDEHFLMRGRLDGSEGTLVELDSASAPPAASAMAYDSVRKIAYVYDELRDKILGRRVRLADVSQQRLSSPGDTGGVEYAWYDVATGLLNVESLYADAVSGRLYFVQETSQGHFLKSIAADGAGLVTHRAMPSGVRDFVIMNEFADVNPFAQDAEFTLFDTQPGNNSPQDFAVAIDPGGAVAIVLSEGMDDGVTTAGPTRSQALLGSPTGAALSIGFPSRPGGSGSFSVNAADLTDGGQNVVGSMFVQGTGDVPFLWSATGGFRGNSELAQPLMDTPSAISASGNEVVGRDMSSAQYWNPAAGSVALPVPAGSTFSNAVGISADAGKIVGSTFNSSFEGTALLWSGAGFAAQALDHLVGGPDDSQANAISPNGDFIVGTSAYGQKTGFITQTETQAVRWLNDGSVMPLGILNERGESSLNGNTGNARAVSDTGIVVGESNGEAFIWHNDVGILALEEVLSQAYGVSLAGVDILQVRDISADGNVVVGAASVNGATRAFRATLPGFPLSWQFHQQLLTTSNDADGDLLNDFEEVAFGSSPIDAGSRFAGPLRYVDSAEGIEQLKLDLPSIAQSSNYRIIVTFTADLTQTPGELTEAQVNALIEGIEVPEGERGFYQVRIEPISQ